MCIRDRISIPRDTRAAIAGTNLTRKINYAHATGGAERMVETVETVSYTHLDVYKRQPGSLNNIIFSIHRKYLTSL